MNSPQISKGQWTWTGTNVFCNGKLIIHCSCIDIPFETAQNHALAVCALPKVIDKLASIERLSSGFYKNLSPEKTLSLINSHCLEAMRKVGFVDY